MKKRFIFIMVLLLMVHGGSATDFSVPCGGEIEISASPVPGFHFVRWNDDVTDTVRTITVFEDATYIAYFAPSCGDYAALPVVNRYDWILMLHVKRIEDELHYKLSPNRVHWYRVVGNPDSLEDPDPTDPKDTYLGEGYSFTLNENLRQTGAYYGVVNLLEEDGLTCSGLTRTEIMSFLAPSVPVRQIQMYPTMVKPNQTICLSGLNPDIETQIRVYSVAGQLLMQAITIGTDKYQFSAYPSTGVYEVQVLSAEDNRVFKYLVRR